MDIAKATSCTGVAPASCRWYEQMLIGFHFGVFSTLHAIMSVMSRIEGSGGKTYVPRERYSLMMSFWVVPLSSRRSAPCSSATVTYRASSHIAVALMVIEVFMRSSGMPSSRARMSPRWTTGTPTLPTSPARERGVRVVARLRGQVERDGEAGLALGEVAAGTARSTRGRMSGRRRSA